jgi:hypothetical protein
MSDSIKTHKCSLCKEIKPVSEFKTRTNGRPQAYCHPCQKLYNFRYVRSSAGKNKERRRRKNSTRREYMKKYLKNYSKTKNCQRLHRKHSLIYREKHPEKCRAHSRVMYAIKSGLIRKPISYFCRASIDCTAKAHEYHHHLGYAKEHQLDVIPVCISCHKTIHK